MTLAFLGHAWSTPLATARQCFHQAVLGCAGAKDA